MEPTSNTPRCSVLSCDRGIYARGLCPKHYQAWKTANRDLEWTPTQYVKWKSGHDKYEQYLIHCIENGIDIPEPPTNR